MHYVNPNRWPIALVAYALVGIVLALDPGPAQWLNHIAISGPHSLGATGGSRPIALGALLTINLLLPLAAVAIAVWYPRKRAAALGGILLMGAYVLTRLLCTSASFWTWSSRFVAAHTSPIEAAGMVGYIAIGVAVVFLTNLTRKVAPPDVRLRCTGCGYLLTGAPGPACPECSAEFDPDEIRRRQSSPQRGRGI